MARMNKKQLLQVYLDNVDKFEFTNGSVGDMRTYSCAIGVIGAALTFNSTPHRKLTENVVAYIREKTGLSSKTLYRIVELNDESDSKRVAIERISQYLGGG